MKRLARKVGPGLVNRSRHLGENDPSPRKNQRAPASEPVRPTLHVSLELSRMRNLWLAVVMSLASFACTKSATNKDVPAEEPSAPSRAPTPPPPTLPAVEPAHAGSGSAANIDRRNDPAFALKEVNGKYIGRVADQCPWGNHPRTPQQVVPTIKDTDYKLVGDKLEIRLPYGGCPQWAGYTVVTGHGSPLPFYVCHEIQHDTCEMAGVKTWVFDISSQLEASKATAVEFAIPTGVF
ncbi:MAG: hypothetical protein HOV81_41880 [Kofleriaceae bacterium]|nr:hypothetical protein [Kofleriaceae bacterium]